MTEATSRMRSARPLWIACAVYLALRILVLITNFDAVSLPNYELMTLGNLAKVVSEGWSGVQLVQHYDNCGGQIVGGLLGAPLYWIFGDGYLTLKLVPLLLGLGTLLLIWWILARCASRRAAIIGVFLFALTPPTLVKYSMLAKGNHFENLFFQLAAWALFLKAHSGEVRPRSHFLWAFAAGFAVFVSMDSAFLVASLAIVHLCVSGPRNTFRDLRFLVPGLLLGLAPLFWAQFASRGGVSSFLDASFNQGKAGVVAHASARIAELWTDLLPRAGVFEDLGPLPRAVAEAMYFGAFLLAWASLVLVVARGAKQAFGRGRAESPEGEPARLELLMLAPLVLYLPLFTLGFAATAHDFDTGVPPVEVAYFRYLVPHFMFSSLVLAVASARWISQAGFKRALGVALASIALSTSLWTLPIVDWSFAKAGSGARHPGYDYEFYSGLVLKDVKWNPALGDLHPYSERLAARITDLPPEGRNHIWFGIASSASLVAIARAKRSDPAWPDVAPLLQLLDLDADHPIDLARGVGSGLRRHAARRDAAMDEAAPWLARLVESNDPRIAFVVEGMCLPFGMRLEYKTAFELHIDRELRVVVPPALTPALVRGQGIACGRLARRGIPADVRQVNAWIEQVPEQEAADFWFGFGSGFSDSSADLTAPPVQAATLSGEPRTALLQGIGTGLRQAFGASDSRARAESLRAILDDEGCAALDRGLEWSNYPAVFAR